MNNCHGKHDGKFCSGSNAGGGDQIKKGADDHFNQLPLSDRQAFVKKINNQLGGTPESFNQPVPLKRPRAEKQAAKKAFFDQQIKRNNYYD